MTTIQKTYNSFLFTAFTAISHFLLFLLAISFVFFGVFAVCHTATGLVAKILPLLTTFVVPAVSLVLAVGVHFLKQPTHNLLCLIAVFFITVFLYLRVGAEFLGFLFLIVYVGAIAILFLFVIMLLNLKNQETKSFPSLGLNKKTLIIGSVFVTIVGLNDLVSTALFQFFINSDVVAMKTENNSVEAVSWYILTRFSDILLFSETLYTYHSALFFMVGTLLLTAMLGAIILATSATDTERNFVATT